VLSESQQGMAKISAEELFDLKQWQKIQDLFAEIIGANLWLIEPQGSSLTTPTIVTVPCAAIAQVRSSPKASFRDCAFKAVQHAIQHQEASYKCPHLLTYYSIPIKPDTETVMVIAVGPVVVGRRETADVYESVCQKHELNVERFLSRVREVRLFSHGNINVIIMFLREMTQHFGRLARQKRELKQLTPDILAGQNRLQSLFSTAYLNLLGEYLLEIASEAVKADSASVLLVNSDEKSFYIQSARGLRAEFVKKNQIPMSQSVAGWVVKRKKAVLIDRDLKMEIPKTKLTRHKIKSSIVVPIQFERKVFGVFCLNAKSSNHRFNKENLLLLSRLGQLTGVALSRVNAD
jgi:putative methionine-R-sulfoxide reductase with GAF domain